MENYHHTMQETGEETLITLCNQEITSYFYHKKELQTLKGLLGSLSGGTLQKIKDIYNEDTEKKLTYKKYSALIIQ